MEWAASTLHTTSEHGVSSITIVDAHTSAGSSRLKWRLTGIQGSHLHRVIYTSLCIDTIWFSWWWALGCSKHVEKWNKYIEKSASSWLLTRIFGGGLHSVNRYRSIKVSNLLSASVFRAPGSNPGGGRDFIHQFSLTLGPTQLPVRLGTGSLFGAWQWPPTNL